MATASEAFIGGLICAAMQHAEIYEIIHIDVPDDDNLCCKIVLRGRKTGIEIVVTVEQSRE